LDLEEDEDNLGQQQPRGNELSPKATQMLLQTIDKQSPKTTTI
jgi:hypothetical protein